MPKGKKSPNGKHSPNLVTLSGDHSRYKEKKHGRPNQGCQIFHGPNIPKWEKCTK
jgi:hypothetical protein